MDRSNRTARVALVASAFASAFASLAISSAGAQDRLRTMSGYDRYEAATASRRSVPLGSAMPTWIDSGRTLEYQTRGKRYRFDFATGRAVELGTVEAEFALGRRAGPARGRQFEFAISPDNRLKAAYRYRNVWLSDTVGEHPVAITTDGNVATRVKNGTASWVYGEELGQITAMWWSPKSDRLAYYRFDETGVPDYFVPLGQTSRVDTTDIEAFPMPGTPNPLVDIFVYDVATKRNVRLDVRDGKPFADSTVGHYVYHVRWSPDGSELTFYRTNRKQNVIELAACSPETGKCRTVIRDEWLPSWVENNPQLTYLKDGHRFIWTSERNGYRNFYLYDLSGKLIRPLTTHDYDAVAVSAVDEGRGVIYYTAHDGDNPMKVQLHRVGLDGKNDVRMSDPTMNHTIAFAPDARHYVDIIESHDRPPVTRLMDASGRMVAELAATDTAKLSATGFRRVELFSYLAADNKTRLYGLLHFPSNFDQSRKYPLLVSVYGGPATNGATERFTFPDRNTELGFLVATLDSRSAAGRGKRFLDAIYEKLGTVEIDDQAAGVKALASRPYVDASRVGIYGTSYGGYASIMAILRYPDVFAAASSSSPVTDWRNYDSIYTERYMWLPLPNKSGYDVGSAMTYASALKGRLLLYYGTADNNVHPSNVLQFIAALQHAGKSFDVQVGPDQGHSGVNNDRMMEFFVDNLGRSAATR